MNRFRSMPSFAMRTATRVTLGSYFGSKPVVLAFVYYSCPMLCNSAEWMTSALDVFESV